MGVGVATLRESLFLGFISSQNLYSKFYFFEVSTFRGSLLSEFYGFYDSLGNYYLVFLIWAN